MYFMVTTVVNIKTCKDFGTKKGDVYIGRRCCGRGESKWGNPFYMRNENERDVVIEKYKKYLYVSGLIDDIRDLKDKRLGCWCKPKACHGDVLAELANSLEE